MDKELKEVYKCMFKGWGCEGEVPCYDGYYIMLDGGTFFLEYNNVKQQSNKNSRRNRKIRYK